ncbi:MAG: hypothetical protein UW68_C0052G0007 [Candidatus Collierbacteria bacterium GW2011_GWB1_44_6]|uniref:Uncharacterized protein n=1 Tax=Candidatus Collierbacteria bacterium GW2011_GWB1_44_6 TaxID=1618384 RepID=A0A0G1LSY9_9BACT|nr:MAG: hypothetical protein UW68_C0052G0007 [Candidatus Collierbacteria bacterium GW2011_GWB1_44_6]
MDQKNFEVGKIYVTTANVDVCCYDAKDCVMPDMVGLQPGTELTYVGPDDDVDGGYVFSDAEGMKYCLHDDDLTALS